MRISDWSSDVCSSDLNLEGQQAEKVEAGGADAAEHQLGVGAHEVLDVLHAGVGTDIDHAAARQSEDRRPVPRRIADSLLAQHPGVGGGSGGNQDGKPVRLAHQLEFRSEEHTSELQSLMRISYAVFCL